MVARRVPDDSNESPAAAPRAAKVGLDRALVGAIDSIAEGVYAVDRRRQITYWSEGAERITGYAAADIVGRHCYSNILNHVDEAGEVLCRGRCPLVAAMGDGRERGASIYLRHREGHRIGVNVRALPFEDDDGRVAGAVEVFAETSSLAVARREAGELRLVAGIDPVTELPNRRTCETQIADRLRRGRRGWSGGLLVLDLDGFKSINDTYGHRTGDEALRVIGRTLARASRAEDYVARWGGDEFVVLVEGGTPASLRSTAERFRALVARSRVLANGAELVLAVSIGGASAVAGDSPETLFDRADAALFSAKRAGRDRFVLAGDGTALDEADAAEADAAEANALDEEPGAVRPQKT